VGWLGMVLFVASGAGGVAPPSAQPADAHRRAHASADGRMTARRIDRMGREARVGPGEG
jgi:hypothetical protein